MSCLNENCQADCTSDFPLCPTCASEFHFTNRADCRCSDCATKRAKAARAERERLAVIAWEEEGRIVYGWSFPAAA